MTFDRTLNIGLTRVVVSELPGVGNQRILSVEAADFKHELTFLAYYEPVLTVAIDLLVVWAGTRLYCINPKAGSICSRTLDSDMVAVIPDGRNLVVVSELTATIVSAGCTVTDSLFAHDEVIVEAKLEDRLLVLRDLRGRVFSVMLPTE